MRRALVHKFRRAGSIVPQFDSLPFEAPAGAVAFANPTQPNAANALRDYLRAQYQSISPNYLLNLNPPQTASWAYSSPMRILRAIMLGQIPAITKRFHDHFLEDVATLWDGKTETAILLGTQQFLDRRALLVEYARSIEAYDHEAREANKPFVRALMALTTASSPGANAVAAVPKALATLSQGR